MDGSFLTNMLAWYAILLFSTTFHEAMHAYVAHRGGDDTAYQGGQVTLNPIPHIQRSPFGLVVVPILTFFLNDGDWMIGWASAPFNPYWAARYPWRSFLMSLAGPTANFILLVVGFVGTIISHKTGYFGLGGNAPWALNLIFSIMMQLNLVLFIFNLMPVPPLDGSELWYLLVKKEEDRLRYRITSSYYSFAGIAISWWLFSNVGIYIAGYVMFILYWGTNFLGLLPAH